MEVCAGAIERSVNEMREVRYTPKTIALRGLIIFIAQPSSKRTRRYAIGDCTTFGLNFTHAATSAALQAVNHVLFGIKNRQDISNQPFVFFTEPEVAQAGPSAIELERNDIWHRVYRLSFDSVDRAIVEGKKGFIKVSVDKQGQLIGATIVGESASELIGYFAVALDRKMKLMDLAQLPVPYPTLGYAIKELARSVYVESFNRKKWLPRFVHRIIS